MCIPGGGPRTLFHAELLFLVAMFLPQEESWSLREENETERAKSV